MSMTTSFSMLCAQTFFAISLLNVFHSPFFFSFFVALCLLTTVGVMLNIYTRWCERKGKKSSRFFARTQSTDILAWDFMCVIKMLKAKHTHRHKKETYFTETLGQTHCLRCTRMNERGEKKMRNVTNLLLSYHPLSLSIPSSSTSSFFFSSEFETP